MLNNTLARAALRAALCAALWSGAAPALAESMPAYPFIHVTGVAYRQVLADIATIDFEVLADDADPAAARALLEARVGEARALMSSIGLDPEDVVVREVRQSLPKDKQPQGGGAMVELRCDVHINVRNLANWPQLVGSLLAKPNLDGFATAFDLSTIGQVDAEMVAEAVVDARRRAEVIAAADGRRLGALTGATTGDLKNLTTSMGLDRGEFRYQGNTSNVRPQNGDPALLTRVQVLKLSQPVDALFRIEGAAGRGADGRRK